MDSSAETVFEAINQDADKLEQKKRAKGKSRWDQDEKRQCHLLNDFVKSNPMRFNETFKITSCDINILYCAIFYYSRQVDKIITNCCKFTEAVFITTCYPLKK